MGEDVDIKYMPTYLDKLLIDFLFNHAKVYLQIMESKKQIEICQQNFLKDLNELKNMNDYNLKNEISPISYNSDVNLFKKRLNNKDIYHKSRKFMKKYSHLIDNKEINQLKEYKKSLSKKKITLPKKFLDEKKVLKKENIFYRIYNNEWRI